MPLYRIARKDEETLSKLAINSGIPDMRGLPLDQITELGDSVLANSIAQFRERLNENGVPLSSFSSGM